MEELNSFYYAMSLMETLYGITMSEDEFEEVAIVAFDLIGNKRTRLYRYETCIDSKTKSVELPCNVYTIEAVTTNFEECAHVTNDSSNGDYSSAYIENQIENYSNILYMHLVNLLITKEQEIHYILIKIMEK